jgi:hypothetical protein
MVRLVANHERSSMRALRGRAKLQTSCLTRLDPKDLHGLLGQRSDNAIDYTATCLRRFDGEVWMAARIGTECGDGCRGCPG